MLVKQETLWSSGCTINCTTVMRFICLNDQHRLRNWFATYSAWSHYMNQFYVQSITFQITENWVSATFLIPRFLDGRPQTAMMSVQGKWFLWFHSRGFQLIAASDCWEINVWNAITIMYFLKQHVDGFVQDCSNSSALAMELMQH